jgi:tRNA(Ile)-lysidine synthase TilS/MesJ
MKLQKVKNKKRVKKYMENYVWEFTNQKKLTKSKFIDYFERKIFKTIRKYDMLGKKREIILKKSNNLNTKVLEKVLSQKFKVELKQKSSFSDLNATDIAEEAFKNILNGKIKGTLPTEKGNKPLYFLSDKEVLLYAKLTNINGIKKKRDKKVSLLLEKFLDKNQDLEQNIIQAIIQVS